MIMYISVIVCKRLGVRVISWEKLALEIPVLRENSTN